MDDETRPNGLLWLPEPPDLTSAEFTYDFYYYQMGRKLREVDGMSEQALSDESAALSDVFSEALDIELSYENTPEIMKLVERATTDEYRAQLVKAREEYLRLKSDPSAVRSAKARAADSSAVYDLQGRRLETAPTAPASTLLTARIRS